jgi:hypothetical protein
LIAVNGGTGFASYAVGDLLYAATTTTFAKLSDVATGNALISGGVSTAPAWGKIGLTTHVSGILPVANGGNGLGVAYTVATLPTFGTQGRRSWVTDALAPVFLNAVVGGGAVVCPVFDNGSAWVVG